MTLFEALEFNKKPLEMLIRMGAKLNDIRYLDLYSEFKLMKSQGEKTTYCIAYLAEKYSISERTICEVFKRFKKECILDAV